MFIVPPPEYHFEFGTGLVSSQPATCQLQSNVMVTLESSITVTGDRNATFSTQNTSNLKTMFDDQLTKGKLVEILKQLGISTSLPNFSTHGGFV